MKNFSAKRYGSLARALAAFAVAGTAPVSVFRRLECRHFGQEWYAVRAYAVDQRRYGAYAQVPTTIRHPVLQYSTAPAFAQSSGSWSAGISLGVDCRRRRDITVHHTGVRFC